MFTYLLKKGCGNHIGPPDKKGNRITYKAGDKVISEDDLVAKFPKKFELLSSPPVDGNAKPDIPVLDSKDKKVSKNKGTPKTVVPEESEHGVDVTKEFPTAVEAKLKVFEKSRWFTVIDPEDNEVLNEKKLRKKKVESFLADYLRPEDDDENDEEDDEEEEYEDDDEE